MTTFSMSAASRLLAVSLLSAAAAAQATTVTLGAAWNTTNLNGPSTSGGSTFTSSSPVAADASQSWNTATDVGVTRTFTFTNPLSVMMSDTAPALENFIVGSSVAFTGPGSFSFPPPFGPFFVQGISLENTGANAKFTFTNQGTLLFSSVNGAESYQWSAKFMAQPSVLVPFTNNQASYTFPTVAMDVTLVSAVPETGTAALLALGLVPVMLGLRRRNRS